MELANFYALYYACHQLAPACSPKIFLYAVGGLDGVNVLNSTKIAERYDPDLDSWTPIASMGTARFDLGLTTLNNIIYAVGGFAGSGFGDEKNYTALNTAERYDPDLDSWTPIASMGTAREYLGLTAL